MRGARWMLVISLLSAACEESVSTGGAGGEGGGAGGDDPAGGGGSTVATACTEAWDELDLDVGACGPEADAVVRSLMNLDGIVIDNNGESMTPCIDVRCDDSFAYVLSNALPHYDFVQTTPNPLEAWRSVYKIPLSAVKTSENASATNAEELAGCVDAYDTFLGGQSPSSEASGQCGDGFLYQDLANGGRFDAAQIACLGTIGVLTNGVPVFGPNEGPTPQPFGTPMFVMPDTASEPASDANGMSVALDLCGGHTAAQMHYHAVNEACFERDDEGAPARSYVDAASTWDVEAMFDGPCTEESGIVGWALDGHPIKGACVCVARDESGACTSLKRARSAWVYGGLGRWGDSPGEATALGSELGACDTDADCGCNGGTCDFYCKYVSVDDPASSAGTSVRKACVLHAHAWCVHDFVDRSAVDTQSEPFVYLDRCNGYEGPDGYAYHATPGFPHMVGCYRGQPTGAGIPVDGSMGSGPPGPGPGPGGG
ncbi:MAG: YHYH protein [Polyangiaceae bacterium]|nr:YHYH protein [Polyangiaceae bacterium]